MSIYYLTGEGVQEFSAFSESTEMYMYMFSNESYGCVVYESDIFILKYKVTRLENVSWSFLCVINIFTVREANKSLKYDILDLENLLLTL